MANFGFVQLFCIVSVLVGVELHCSDGWIRYQDSCYYFEDLVNKTWIEALFFCPSINGYLVRIESKEENDFIKHELSKLHLDQLGFPPQFWTAGNDKNTEGHWMWGTSTERVALDFWHQGEPNNLGDWEDCMTFSPFDWNDSGCDYAFSFICEMEDPLAVVVG